jgi:hypothetical protein
MGTAFAHGVRGRWCGNATSTLENLVAIVGVLVLLFLTFLIV